LNIEEKAMKRRFLLFGAATLIAVAAVVIIAQNRRQIREFLTGYEEVPSVSTEANAEFKARIANDDNSIQYELSYADLEGSILQAHIHFGQTSVNGAIIVWLCGNPPAVTPPPGTQTCPAPPATISGTIRPADVVGQPISPTGVAGQGIQPGEFDELLRALRAGKTYVNIHTTKFPTGEVRSQIGAGESGEGDHH
jgi:hypothetical protein